MADVGPAASDQTPPVCPRHPDRVSYVRCQRCDRPTCPQCQVAVPVGVQCVDCARAERDAVGVPAGSVGRNSLHRTPWLTYGLIAANVLFYLYGTSTGLRQWQLDYGFIPYLDDEWYRWVTNGFVHAGVLHIALNMYMLFQFGSQLERVMGPVRYAVLYLGSLLGGSAAIALLAPKVSLHVGASGAIFGLIVATGILLYRLNAPWQSLAMSAGIWLAAGLVIPGISWQGHAGGAIAGAVITVALSARRQVRRK